MVNQLMQKVEESFIKRSPDIRSGDTVQVHMRITEGGKERIQVFEGIVIAISGTGLGKTITVRKVSAGVGVEKIIPVNAPVVKKIDVIERGDVRRSKLYYIRNAVGKRSLDVGYTEGFEGIEETVESKDAVKSKETVDSREAVDAKEAVKEETKVKEEKEQNEKNEEGSAGTAPSDKQSSPAEAASAKEEVKDEDKKDDSTSEKEAKPQ